MYVIMLGAPGTGKGTIGSEVCNKFNLTHLSTGDIFREEIKNQTELGKLAEQYMSRGNLVPDEVTIEIVKHKLDSLEGVLLDGFPRTISQAESLKEYLESKGKSVNIAINLDIPDEDIIKRTSSRVVCSNKECKASFNTIFMPPKQEGICDKCGSKLIKRADDNPETIKQRLDVYHKETEPLINYYINEGLLTNIKIDIYSPTTKEDTTNRAIEEINKRN